MRYRQKRLENGYRYSWTTKVEKLTVAPENGVVDAVGELTEFLVKIFKRMELLTPMVEESSGGGSC